MPERPPGAVNWTLETRCSASPFCRSIAKFVKLPAWTFVDPATIEGANGSGEEGHGLPSGPLLIAKAALVRKSARNGVLHGVKSAFVPYPPHAVGVSSAARVPPLNDSLKFENGRSGVPEKVVVRRPVASSRRTSPTSLTLTPSPDAATSRRRFGGFD